MTPAIDALRALAEKWEAEAACGGPGGEWAARREDAADLRALIDSDAFRAMGRDSERLDFADSPSGILRLDRRETHMAVPSYLHWGHLAGPNGPKSLRAAIDAAIVAREGS